MVLNIAFFGPAGSGKSTMAEELSVHYGAVRLSFALPLREEVSRMYDIPMEDLTKKPLPDQLRQLLQVHGTQIRRNIFDVEYWTKKFEHYFIQSRALNNAIITVDDMRYINEYELCKRLDFVMILCKQSAMNQTLSANAALHSSEQDWPLFKPDMILPWVPVTGRMAMLEEAIGRVEEPDLT